jgi:hypothetical protein
MAKRFFKRASASLGRQVVAHPAQCGSGGLVVVHPAHRLAQLGRAARALRAVAQRVVEHHDLLGTGHVAQQGLGLAVVDVADGGVVRKIGHHAAVRNLREAAAVEREFVQRHQRAAVANRHATRLQLARDPGRAGRRLEGVAHGPALPRLQVIEFCLHPGQRCGQHLAIRSDAHAH